MDKELAKKVAIEATAKYDFDCREVLTCESLDEESAKAICLRADIPLPRNSASNYHEVVVRVFCSKERINSLIEPTDSVEDVAMKHDYLGGGSKIRVIVADGKVVNEEMIGVQLS